MDLSRQTCTGRLTTAAKCWRPLSGREPTGCSCWATCSTTAPATTCPEYAPKEVIPLLNGKKEKLLCVRGNCDAEVDQMVLEFPVLADYAVLPVGQRLIYATHGHIYHVKNLPPLAREMCCCTGIPMFRPGQSSGREIFT